MSCPGGRGGLYGVFWGVGRFEEEGTGLFDWKLAAALFSLLPCSDPDCFHLQPGTALPCLYFQMVRRAVVATGEPDGFLLGGAGPEGKGEDRSLLLRRERVCVHVCEYVSAYVCVGVHMCVC